jgi:V-type H+-transporting ATPase S1 subunit
MAARRFAFEILFCCFVLLVCGSYGANFVPVFMWESSKPTDVKITSPALKKYSTDEFADFFVHKLSLFSKKPLVVVFTEENLSVEDFSWQSLSESSAFPDLESVITRGANVDFLPSVDNPIRALRRLDKLGYQLQTVRDPDTVTVPEVGGVVMVVKMEDAKGDDNRLDLLRRHDKIISRLYSRLVSQRNDVVGVYTGRFNSWIEPENEPALHRVRRQVGEPTSNTTYLLINVTSILMFASHQPNLTVSGVSGNLTLKSVTPKLTATSQSARAKFTSTNSSEQIFLEFFIFNSTSSIGYWSLENVTYSVNYPNATVVALKPEFSIVAPVTFSYHCSAETVFQSNNITLTLHNFQAQPFMDKTTAFGDAYNCEMFFTPAIWSGIFVTSILGLIMIWGLVMIMDIRTMDQFDDPKGKTITVNVSE